MGIIRWLAIGLSTVATLLPLHASASEGKGIVLIVASSADSLALKDGRTIVTGTYLNELVIPATALIEAGYELRLATPTGKKPTIDARSRVPSHFAGDEEALRRATGFFNAHPSLQHPISLEQALNDGLDQYVAVFVPGGHAPFTDLAESDDFAAVLRHFHQHGKPTALLCHAPVALIATVRNPHRFRAAMANGDEVSAGRASRDWLYAGYEMTVFSNTEEVGVEDRIFQGRLAFYAADALRVAGGVVTQAKKPFEPHAIRYRELITGQNPASDHVLASLLLDALQSAHE